MLSVANKNVLLSVIMLNAVKLSVVMLSVVVLAHNTALLITVVKSLRVLASRATFNGNN
jgi:hypothetical protein